jgi:hypothetical protein
VEGQSAVDRLDRRWQDGTSGYGSGAVLALNSTCGDVEASRTRGQNMLSNGGFERDDTVTPLDWVIQTGAAGVTIETGTIGARGSQSVKFVGNSSVLHNIYEVMGNGPRPNLKTNTVYVISAYLRGDGGTVNTGTIRLGLRDSSNAEISGCAITRNMAGVGLSVGDSSWTRITGSFTTPLTLGADTRFAVNFTVALGAQTLLVDEVVLAEVVPLYSGGIGVAVVAGTSDWELDDRMAASVAKTSAEWQVELDRYLNLAGRDIQLPTSTSPTFAATHIG